MFKDEEALSKLLDLEDVKVNYPVSFWSSLQVFLKDKGKLLEDEAKSHFISAIHKVLAPFMLRREKKSVLPDIVPKKEVIIHCSLTEMQSYLYRATLQGDVNKLYMQKEDSQQVVHFL